MKLINRIAAIFFILTLFSCINGPNGEISEEMIIQMGDSIKAAAFSKDTENILVHLSDDVNIELEIPTPEGYQKLHLDKSRYETMLNQTFSESELLTMDVQDLTIDIRPEGTTADVYSTILESYNINGQIINTTTQETLVVKIVNGKPLIQTIQATVEM